MVAPVSLKISVAAQSLPEDDRHHFVLNARGIFRVYSHVRQSSRIPATRLELLLTDDFVDDVRRYMRPIADAEGDQFTTERVGGQVLGKVLPQTQDYSHALIVFDANLWLQLDGFSRVFCLAHELAHPTLERVCHLSGALEGVIFPSVTGHELARSASRIRAHEYAVDRLADLVLRHGVKALAEGRDEPLGYWEMFGKRDIDVLAGALRDAYPLWPDTVQEYREWKIDLMTMWGRLARSIDQTLNCLGHIQAAADSAGARSPLEDEAIACLPAVKLYLAEPWARYIEALRRHPVLPSVSRYLAMDREITRVGEAVMLDIWGRLGLTVEDKPNRQWALWVKEPLR